jgi:hypothetical protein
MKIRRPHPERLLTLVIGLGVSCIGAGSFFQIETLSVIGGCLLLPFVAAGMILGLLFFVWLVVSTPFRWIRSRHSTKSSADVPPFELQ